MVHPEFEFAASPQRIGRDKHDRISCRRFFSGRLTDFPFRLFAVVAEQELDGFIRFDAAALRDDRPALRAFDKDVVAHRFLALNAS